ncbi:NusG domain II-containing protein [candidate division WOR-3 bacterium]|nr:NusG domain II-containing protein [candidate division WOR-3 bacterium]
MRKIFRKYPYPADYIVIALFISLSVFFFAKKLKNTSMAFFAVVETFSGEKQVIGLFNDTVLEVRGKIGITKVEIHAGKARILSSPCRRKLCERRGWISASWESSACLPNGVWLYITGEKTGIDAVTF